MYQSPIELFQPDQIIEKMTEDIRTGIDSYIYQAVLQTGIKVDKYELIRALEYDRDQYEKGYIEGLMTARWISVEEHLPLTDDHVLCCTRTKKGTTNVVIGYYMDGMWRCGMNPNVTHWMPLPETPEEGQK